MQTQTYLHIHMQANQAYIHIHNHTHTQAYSMHTQIHLQANTCASARNPAHVFKAVYLYIHTWSLDVNIHSLHSSLCLIDKFLGLSREGCRAVGHYVTTFVIQWHYNQYIMLFTRVCILSQTKFFEIFVFITLTGCQSFPGIEQSNVAVDNLHLQGLPISQQVLIYFPAQYPRLIRPYLCCNTELFWEGGTPSENDLGAIIIMMKSNLLVMLITFRLPLSRRRIMIMIELMYISISFGYYLIKKFPSECREIPVKYNYL